MRREHAASRPETRMRRVLMVAVMASTAFALPGRPAEAATFTRFALPRGSLPLPGTAAAGAGHIDSATQQPPATRPSWWAEGNQETSNFGTSVSTAGDVDGDGFDEVIVGADLFDHGETDEGAAFLYRGSPRGPGHKPNWAADGNLPSGLFGLSVSKAGDVNGDGYADVVIGGVGAFVYEGSPDGLSDSPDWTSTAGTGKADTAGDVNGDGFDDVIFGVGAGLVYEGSPVGLHEVPDWSGSRGTATEVSSAGDVNADGYDDVIIGDPYFPSAKWTGRAYLYLGSADGLSSTPDWIGFDTSSQTYETNYGFSVDGAGDVNGDGYDDVVVGEPLWAGDCSEGDGRLLAYFGSPDGLSTTPGWTAEGCDTAIGWSFQAAGDVNADGFADVLMGTPWSLEYCCYNYVGQAWLYLGSSTGLVASSWTQIGGQADSYFAGSVAGAGDVNGDGYADLMIGAPLHSGGLRNEGGAVIYPGRANPRG
jgi:FG-GAP repeat/FG-GAP-like repeat